MHPCSAIGHNPRASAHATVSVIGPRAWGALAMVAAATTTIACASSETTPNRDAGHGSLDAASGREAGAVDGSSFDAGGATDAGLSDARTSDALPSDGARTDGGHAGIDSAVPGDAAATLDAASCGDLGRYCRDDGPCAGDLVCIHPGESGHGLCLPAPSPLCGTASPCPGGGSLSCFNVIGDSMGPCLSAEQLACSCAQPMVGDHFPCGGAG